MPLHHSRWGPMPPLMPLYSFSLFLWLRVLLPILQSLPTFDLRLSLFPCPSLSACKGSDLKKPYPKRLPMKSLFGLKRGCPLVRAKKRVVAKQRALTIASYLKTTQGKELTYPSRLLSTLVLPSSSACVCVFRLKGILCGSENMRPEVTTGERAPCRWWNFISYSEGFNSLVHCRYVRERILSDPPKNIVSCTVRIS